MIRPTTFKLKHLLTSSYFSCTVIITLTVAATTVPTTLQSRTSLSENMAVSSTAVGVNTSAVVSGTDLYCYECDEQYDSTFDPTQSPCLNNLSQIAVRQCSPGDSYCQVTRETFNQIGFIVSMFRGCVSSCNYGCYGHKYGPGTVVCTTCCRSPGCNSGNSAPSLTTDVITWILTAIVHASLQI